MNLYTIQDLAIEHVKHTAFESSKTHHPYNDIVGEGFTTQWYFVGSLTLACLQP